MTTLQLGIAHVGIALHCLGDSAYFLRAVCSKRAQAEADRHKKSEIGAQVSEVSDQLLCAAFAFTTAVMS